MKQYKLTEQESRELAAKFASQHVGGFGGRTLTQWFENYMQEYNKLMNVIEQYNQSVED